jgi:flagellar assembly protein FliH
MTSQPHIKFGFDTVFDSDGEVSSGPPVVKRVYLPAEVEEIRARAYAEGERAADARGVSALAEISRSCAAAMGSLARVAHDHREASAGLALAVGRKIADSALDRFPEAPIAAAMAELVREIESRPVLKVQVATGLVEPVEAVLRATAEAMGYPGSIMVTADTSLPRAAFAFDWGEGRATFDPQASAERVAAALETALAAEGLHAEPLTTSESETDHG